MNRSPYYICKKVGLDNVIFNPEIHTVIRITHIRMWRKTTNHNDSDVNIMYYSKPSFALNAQKHRIIVTEHRITFLKPFYIFFSDCIN